MPDIHIHQIYYSNETRDAIDKGFIGLDNMSNERPDWREYWPIRRQLLNEPLVADDFYGFFSPKFRTKTGLDSSAVFDFIRRNADASDVFLFSPFFDQSACYLNVFEQADNAHDGIINTFRECISRIAPQVAFDPIVMDSRTIVFCNFLVAKPRFWLEWLALCEIIFQIAEAGDTDLGKSLNSDADHLGGHAPVKVFVIERMASLMLSTRESWQPMPFKPMALPRSNANVARFGVEPVILDALKIAYNDTGHREYLDAFHNVRGVMIALMKRMAG